MKLNLYLFTFLFACLAFFGFKTNQDGDYYWYKGKKIPLTLNESKRYILFSKKPVDTDLRSIIRIKKILTTKSLVAREVTLKDDERWWAVVSQKDRKIIRNELIEYEAPFFNTANGKELGLSHLFYVKLNKLQDLSVLEKLASENSVEILGSNKFMPLWFTLACNKKSKGNALVMSNLFYKSGLFNASEPDLSLNIFLENQGLELQVS